LGHLGQEMNHDRSSGRHGESYNTGGPVLILCGRSICSACPAPHSGTQKQQHAVPIFRRKWLAEGNAAYPFIAIANR